MQRIALGPAAQCVEIEPRLIELGERAGGVERIKPDPGAALERRPDPRRFAGFEQLFERAVPEALDHTATVGHSLSYVKRWVTGAMGQGQGQGLDTDADRTGEPDDSRRITGRFPGSAPGAQGDATR